MATNNKELFEKIKIEYKKLPQYNEKKIENLSQKHRWIYYKLYYLGLKYPRLNILNLVYVYFFKNYYLYQLDESKIELIKNKFETFEQNKIERINIVNFYLNSLKDIVIFPKINNKENILSRLTVLIDNAEEISKQIRDNGIPSNTMYPMLVDRFKLFFDKKEFENSFKLKGKMLNLWVNDVNEEKINKTVEIVNQEVL